MGMDARPIYFAGGNRNHLFRGIQLIRSSQDGEGQESTERKKKEINRKKQAHNKILRHAHNTESSRRRRVDGGRGEKHR